MDSLPNSLTPLCFNRHEFTKPSFNVETFLSQTRRHVGLEQIKEDLHLYLKILQNAMIELINKDYADFVNLSSNLVNLRGSVEKLQSDVGELCRDFGQYAERLTVQVEDLSEKLDKKKRNSEHLHHLQRSYVILDCLETVKRILGNQERQGIDSDLAQRIGMLIRRARRVLSMMTTSQTPLQDEAMTKAIEVAITAFQRPLECLLVSEINTQCAENVELVLTAYDSCNRMETAQAVFMCEFLDPVIDKSLEENKSFGRTRTQGQELQLQLNCLSQLYRKFRSVFAPGKSDVSVILSSNSSDRSSQMCRVFFAQRFLVNSILANLLTRLDRQFPGVLVSTEPDRFHECFSRFVEFCTSLADVETEQVECGSEIADFLVRKNPLLAACFVKFSLPVYFQLRLQEITGDLYNEIKQQCSVRQILKVTNIPASASANALQLKLPSHFVDALRKLFSPKVFLQPLCNKFWELHCQMLNRYLEWLNDVIRNGLSVPKTTGVSHLATSSVLNGNSAVPKLISPSHSANDVPHTAAQQTSKTSSATTTVEISSPGLADYEIIALLSSDSVRLRGLVTEHFQQHVQKLIQNCGVQVQDLSLFHCTLDEWATQLQSACTQLVALVSTNLASKMEKILVTGVIEVPRHYRWTRKEAPTRAMPYIVNAFKSLHEFGHSKLPLEKADYRQVLNGCFDAVVRPLCEQIHTVVTSGEKATSSLSRLKKVKATGGVADQPDQAAMDSEKIRMQLKLDVQEFEKLILAEFRNLNEQPSADLQEKLELLIKNIDSST